MKSILKGNIWFFLPYFILLIIGAFVLITYPKTAIHWYLNQQNHIAADYFFKYFTHLGDGTVIAISAILLLFIRYRFAVAMVLGNLASTVLVQFIKRVIFPDSDRPIVIFQDMDKLHIVEGIYVNVSLSFPSGHTATGFTIFLLFALIIQNNLVKFLAFVVAVLIAYSRVYLSQHFFVDIYFGSVIGVLSCCLAYYWTRTWHNPKLDRSLLWKNKSFKNSQ
jgi:membrane-associated phospholipid phosphatase